MAARGSTLGRCLVFLENDVLLGMSYVILGIGVSGLKGFILDFIPQLRREVVMKNIVFNFGISVGR